MTKTELLTRLCMRQSQLARLLGVSRSAVAQWPDDEPIPEKQELRLRYELRPEVFAEGDLGRHRSSAASAGSTAEATPTVLTGKVA